MHGYGKVVGEVEQINFPMQQPMVAACTLHSEGPRHSVSVPWEAEIHTQSSLGPHIPLGGLAPLCLWLVPFPVSPSNPPGCSGDAAAFRERSTPAFASSVLPSRLAPGIAVYFFPRDRTKISLSHPPAAAARDITQATLLFPGPSAVTALTPRRPQLLLLLLPLAVAEISEVLTLSWPAASPERSRFVVSGWLSSQAPFISISPIALKSYLPLWMR